MLELSGEGASGQSGASRERAVRKEHQLVIKTSKLLSWVNVNAWWDVRLFSSDDGLNKSYAQVIVAQYDWTQIRSTVLKI